jgi:hypothetical protein
LKSPGGNRTFVSCQCKPSKEFMCELRKRIVARAHDHDAITTTGQPDQHVATGAAVLKSKGLSPAPLDFANNIFAADATVDCAAEINGLVKIKSFGIAPLVERTVGTLNPSTPRLDDQSERGHATTANAAEKVISELGHWRNLEGLPMRCNAGCALG